MDEWTRLAIAARRGGESETLAFVRATQADVWRLCAHLGDRDCADDLAQEAFLRALRALPRFRGDSPVRPWLFTIVRRVVADDIAARKRRRNHPVDATWAGQVDDHAGAVSTEALLAELDLDRREAFVLTQLLGYSYAETAQICDCPVGTIRSRVARAREQLVAWVIESQGTSPGRSTA